jgi:uracil-DNA glycosylase
MDYRLFTRTWLIDLIPRQWLRPLHDAWNSIDFFNLSDYLTYEYLHREIFPHPESIFNALKYCSPVKQYADVFDDDSMRSEPLPVPKVVILGQDPYAEVDYTSGKPIPKASGYAFGVQPGLPPPASLVNMYLELQRDELVKFEVPKHGYLESWARQGVVALNTVLTVQKNNRLSHENKGWERFTDEVIRAIDRYCDSVVFMLWGVPARSKASLIDQKKHLVLCTSHPSPNSFNRGFYGCGHFSEANKYLKRKRLTPINWNSLNE